MEETPEWRAEFIFPERFNIIAGKWIVRHLTPADGALSV
jgi:hypothetical protein